MENRKTHFGITFTLISLFLAGLIVLTGCKKKSEPMPAKESEKTVSAAIQQTTCPVMGGAINKDIFTEYKGKKVYFCCLECKAQFLKSPEKYILKLPQFSN